ncbi:MAG: DUF86 domain-containing protein [Candidatus Heimdallarchaeota archaeon]|nr:DUF86 domain-containing protein [Candidatus Heimdallarchaeota archaeon]
MVKKPITRLKHILESLELIESYLEGKTKEDFINSQQLQDAVIRRMEIIGEAIKIIPEDIRKLDPTIPWKQIAGMRDILIHQYFGVDLDLTWEAVKKENPKLKTKLEAILKALEKEKEE